MNITIDTIVFQQQARGGVSRIFQEILPRMCQLDPDLWIHFWQLTADRSDLKQPLPELPRMTHHVVTPHAVGHRRPYRFWRQVIAFQNTTERLYDNWRRRDHIWHSTYFTLPPKGWHGKQVVTVYDMAYEVVPRFDDAYSEYFRDLKRACILHADHVICISAFTRQEVIDYYHLSPDHVHAVPLAHNSAVFRVLPEESLKTYDAPQHPYLLYVSGRGAHKNFDGFLKAFSTWKQRGAIQIVVVGTPFTTDEKRLIAELGLQGQVQVLTNVDDVRLAALYNRAAAFVYPSRYEGFGLSLLEAMACACPIVASDIPSSREVAADVPFYFQLDDNASFHAALDAALADGLGQQRIQAGHARTEEFSWERTARQTLDVYRRCRNNI